VLCYIISESPLCEENPLAKLGFADRREPPTLLGQSALGRLASIGAVLLLLWAAVGWALDWWP